MGAGEDVVVVVGGLCWWTGGRFVIDVIPGISKKLITRVLCFTSTSQQGERKKQENAGNKTKKRTRQLQRYPLSIIRGHKRRFASLVRGAKTRGEQDRGEGGGKGGSDG